MKKLFIFPIMIILIIALISCGKENNNINSTSDTPFESDKIEASEEIQDWAQYEIDNLIHMLTVDGFIKDGNKDACLITIDIKENKITNLKLVKSLELIDNTTIDLYQIDFKLLFRDLPDSSIFTTDDNGWITSDDNFSFADANGVEVKKGQLYLLIHNNNGTLTSMGIRRAEPLTAKWCKDLIKYYNVPKVN